MKKILYLSHRIPYPPNKGDKIRSFNEIRHLSKKYIIDLITFADDPIDLQYRQHLKKYCRKIQVFSLNKNKAYLKGFLSLIRGRSISQGYFYSKRAQELFNSWIAADNYDAIVCFSSPMAEYLFRSEQTTPILIMDFCDLDSDKWLQYSSSKSFPANWIFKIEAEKLLDFEKKINCVFTRSIFILDKEAELFTDYFPGARNISIIPNGVDHEFFNTSLIKKSKNISNPMIMFSGAMDYYANVDGVVWFAEKILPNIKKDIPDIKFYIVGNKPAPQVTALEKDPCIIVTGFVDDIREYYKAADLCVIPLRIARGVQNKVLEALSMEKMVITTTHAIQGIHQDVHNILQIEDNPQAFAQKVVCALQDTRRNNKDKAARQFVLHHYNWEDNLTQLCTLISSN